jgi:hypothetical protein
VRLEGDWNAQAASRDEINLISVVTDFRTYRLLNLIVHSLIPKTAAALTEATEDAEDLRRFL